MSRNHINGMFIVEKKILDFFHYILPNDFQKPSRKIYGLHYLIITTIIVYAFITVIDICNFDVGSLRSVCLLGLSSGTIIFTTAYTMKRSEEMLRKKLLSKAKYKNRHGKITPYRERKNFIDVIFKRKIYKRQLNMEIIVIFVGIIATVCAWQFKFQCIVIVIILKIIISILAAINGFIMMAQNIAEFYRAEDFETKGVL